MLNFLPKGLDEFTVPEEINQAFCAFFAESTDVFQRDASFIEIVSNCHFHMKKPEMESLKFSFFRATGKMYDLSHFIKFSYFLHSTIHLLCLLLGAELIPLTINLSPPCKSLRTIITFDYEKVDLQLSSQPGHKKTFLIFPRRQLDQSTFKKWYKLCNEF